MALQATLVGVSPADNPDRLQVLVTFSGNYGVNGVGDQLNLAPYDAGNNAGGMKNPSDYPLPSLPVGLEIAPQIEAENIGGYYVQPNPLVAPGVANGVAGSISMKTGFFLRQFAPGGAELASNAAYNAAVIAAGAGVLLEVILPKDQ